jgi:hypothetical protein
LPWHLGRCDHKYDCSGILSQCPRCQGNYRTLLLHDYAKVEWLQEGNVFKGKRTSLFHQSTKKFIKLAPELWYSWSHCCRSPCCPPCRRCRSCRHPRPSCCPLCRPPPRHRSGLGCPLTVSNVINILDRSKLVCLAEQTF